MLVEQRTQLDDLILDALNVKQYIRKFGNTEKGELWLVFDGEYYVTLGGKQVDVPKTLACLLESIC